MLLESANHILLSDEPAWRAFLSELRAFLGTQRPAEPRRRELSPRELEVLELVAAGLTNEAIAERLYLSVRTVERHLSNVYAKLRVSGKAGRAAAAAGSPRLASNRSGSRRHLRAGRQRALADCVLAPMPAPSARPTVGRHASSERTTHPQRRLGAYGRADRDARRARRRGAHGCTCGSGAIPRARRSCSSTAGRSASSAGRGRSPAPLADDFRLVTFDIRGHGMSEKPREAEPYVDAGLWADDVAAVIEQTGLDRPVLVAWSYGGFIVTDYLRAYGGRPLPASTSSGRRCCSPPPSTTSARASSRTPTTPAAPDLPTSIAAIRRFLDACTAEALSEDDWSAALCWNMVVPREVRAALFAREIDADDVLSGLSVPVLVTHGRLDTIVLPSMAEHVLEVCRTAQPSWYDGVGHLPFLEDPVRFDRDFGDFVRQVNAPVASLSVRVPDAP